MKRKQKTPRSEKRNYGYGKQLLYAFSMALNALLGQQDHFGTRRTHRIRIRVFVEFCQRHGIRDARDIDLELVEAYGNYLRHRLHHAYEWADGRRDNTVAASYAHNLISTVNTCMYALRRDEKLHLSARKALGVARSNVRKTQIHADMADTKSAADRMIASGNELGAAVVLLTRAWGMRTEEAYLQDLERMMREVAATGSAAILEGTKGGRRCRSRTISAGEFQREALEFALSVRPAGSKCLLLEADSAITFYRRELGRCRRILKKCGIPSFRELRSGFAQDVYEEIVRGPSPLRGPIGDRVLDRVARQTVARLLGHGRPQVASSYIGGY
ncbi:integrase domain-containing protein [Marinobacter sp. S6332]|uniref:integrase domain-containing protein n=1 Tax=Marinobacter sp. S6332 TaxID=2926403 RepID=UPI001FF5B615|nr:integrase domain-containing protein [Marinobacter sp. S6332]MCK0164941.1 integrase domain-containing protein [Marinobacter sp. S6332]